MKQISELKDFIEKRKPNKFVFSTLNQEVTDAKRPYSLQIDFTEIEIQDYFPYQITFKNEFARLNLRCITNVEFIENYCLVGDVIKIHCSVKNFCSLPSVYTIVAQHVV